MNFRFQERRRSCLGTRRSYKQELKRFYLTKDETRNRKVEANYTSNTASVYSSQKEYPQHSSVARSLFTDNKADFHVCLTSLSLPKASRSVEDIENQYSSNNLPVNCKTTDNQYSSKNLPVNCNTTDEISVNRLLNLVESLLKKNSRAIKRSLQERKDLKNMKRRLVNDFDLVDQYLSSEFFKTPSKNEMLLKYQITPDVSAVKIRTAR